MAHEVNDGGGREQRAGCDEGGVMKGQGKGQQAGSGFPPAPRRGAGVRAAAGGGGRRRATPAAIEHSKDAAAVAAVIKALRTPQAPLVPRIAGSSLTPSAESLPVQRGGTVQRGGKRGGWEPGCGRSRRQRG